MPRAIFPAFIIMNNAREQTHLILLPPPSFHHNSVWKVRLKAHLAANTSFNIKPFCLICTVLLDQHFLLSFFKVALLLFASHFQTWPESGRLSVPYCPLRFSFLLQLEIFGFFPVPNGLQRRPPARAPKKPRKGVCLKFFCKCHLPPPPTPLPLARLTFTLPGNWGPRFLGVYLFVKFIWPPTSHGATPWGVI